MANKDTAGDTADNANPGQRIDKWLWCARFFKTRSLAAEAVSGGKVHVDGQRVKPSRLVRAAMVLEIRRGTEQWQVDIVATAKRRGPASEAHALYEETADSLARREFEREARKLARQTAPVVPDRRPGKRDRRKLTAFKQGHTDQSER
jgi:ribosome-associated heat shock protein Hsp15